MWRRFINTQPESGAGHEAFHHSPFTIHHSPFAIHPSSRRGVAAAVDPTSLAARADIRPGEVITHVHGQAVRSVGDFDEAMKDHDPARGVRFTIRRGNAQRFVVLRGG